jgi:ABC-type sugar transport system ATPase subunit
MTSVDVVNLNKDFGEHRILKNINLSIAEGEFVVLVGPSGCGKSTLLRIIAGLETASSGVVAFGGKSVNAISPQARNVAMVFQSYALYPHMRVRDNLAFGLRRRGAAAAEIERCVAHAAKLLELERYLDRYPRQLSGGQRQRVAIGRAIVREPAVFLLDEPLSNLDAQLRLSMRLEIRALQERLGVTTIYVTHDQVEATTLAHRIVVLNGGEIMQVGNPLDLYDRPDNKFVAGFIGSPPMNFVSGVARDGSVRASDGNAIVLPGSYAHVAGELIVGLRPEHVSLVREQGDERLTIAGVIRHIEHLGAETEFYVESCGTQICVRHFGREVSAVGTAVRLAYNVDRLHLFDKATGRRISERDGFLPQSVR